MQMAEQLRSAGIPTFPCWTRYNSDKDRWEKGPAVRAGMSWKDASLLPAAGLDWGSGVFGVPVPDGVVVIDLDTYKGATRAAVEAHLGAQLDWGRAALQRTISGGEHYAFRCDWPVRQGDSLGVPGFDTRAAGRGFVCSGAGYTPLGAAGVFALAHPACLPELPAAARAQLERTDTGVGSTPAPAEPDAQVANALAYIDPGCSRAEWVRIGMALAHQYQDDAATGLGLFDRWSAGEFWSGGCPENYNADHIESQWGSFKADGGVTASTLFYRAIQNGWRPPATFDSSLAFGSAAASTADFDGLVERIRREGDDVKAVHSIVEDIQGAQCSALQTALLAAELKAQLRDVGVKDVAVAGHIDGLLRTQVDRPAAPGAYDKNDTDNAAVFLQKFYPDNTLVRCDGEFYMYTGKAWAKLTNDSLRHQVTLDMARQRMQDGRISACIRMVSGMCPVLDGQLNDVPGNLVIFENGVLDLTTGVLSAHDPALFTTNMLPYSWQPEAQCPQWEAFLADVFDNDHERIALLQEWFGYLLTRDYSHQKMMLLLGPPRCGKGTIGRVLGALVGKGNFSGGSLSALATDAFLSSLRDKTVLFIGDAAKRIQQARVNEVTERLKSVSGNDAVSFDRKFLSALSESLPTRITLAANHVPQLFDDSGALASRLLLLTFDNSYLGREDITLAEGLLAEVSGIAAWAMRGRARLQQHGRFTEPAASREEAAYIEEAYSPLMQFLQSACELTCDSKVSSTDLYEAYRAWCVVAGEDLMRRKTFVGAFKDATRGRGVHYGTQRAAGAVFRGFRGIALRPEAQAQAQARRVRLRRE